MLCAFDLDGCIDAFPREFQSIMSALKAAGHRIVVVTGTADVAATEQVFHEKAEYLASLGCGECYDQLIVVAHPSEDVADMKADVLEDIEASVLFDNRKKNAKKAPCLTLVPWQSRK